MAKLLLLSVLFATVAVPSFFALDPNPRRGLRRCLFVMSLFNVAYVFIVYLVVPHFL